MTDVILERTFAEGITLKQVVDGASTPDSCFELYKLQHRVSYLAADGKSLVCCFRAPDAESARTALRKARVNTRVLWPGDVYDAGDVNAARINSANVLVERSFAEPVEFAAIQALARSGAACLATHKVNFVRTMFSRDCKRMICLYAAPDAESVRIAQRQAAMPFDRVWAFQAVWSCAPQ